jgi:HEAT repeat protein
MHGILEAIYDRDFELASKAIRAMANLGSEKALEGFRFALRHPEPQIRFDAARTLGQTGMKPPDAAPYLTEALHDEDNKVRGAAAQSLGEIGEKQAVDALIEALNDSDANVRASVATALGKLRDVTAIPHLISMLEKNRRDGKMTTNEITAVVTALRRIGTPEAMKVVEPFEGHYDYWVDNIDLP